LALLNNISYLNQQLKENVLDKFSMRKRSWNETLDYFDGLSEYMNGRIDSLDIQTSNEEK
jgi:hypothetical protein